MQAVNSIMSTLGLNGKVAPVPSLPYHPLNPLDNTEMTKAVVVVDKYLRSDQQGKIQPFQRLWYKAVTLREPPKAVLAPYLDDFARGIQGDKPARRVDVLVGAKQEKGPATWYGKCVCYV
jgi:Cu2+-containing amine oxidase